MKASASKTGLLMMCAYPFREDVEWPKEKPSKAAALGTAVHAHIAAFVNHGTIPSFDVDDWVLRRALTGIDVAKVRDDIDAEVTLAMMPVDDMGFGHTLTIGKDVTRDAYPQKAFCGTADVLIHEVDGWRIRDWKTGSPSDAEEWQLRALAAMLHESTGGEPIVDGKAVYLTDGAPRFSGDYLEGTDPVEDAKEIRRRLAMIPGSEPTPGAHCKSMWCPIRKTCGAVNG